MDHVTKIVHNITLDLNTSVYAATANRQCICSAQGAISHQKYSYVTIRALHSVLPNLLRQSIWQLPKLLSQILLHPLHTKLHGSLNIINLHILGQISQQFGSIQFIIRPPSLENLSLLFQRKVFVFVRGVNVLGVQVEAFIVTDDSGVAKVVHAG